MAQKVLLKKSNVVDKTPSSSSLEFGELAINFASGSGKSFLATKKYNGTVAKFHEDTYNDAKFATKDELGNIQSVMSNYALSATVKNEISALTTTLEADEYVIAQAFNSHNDRITALEEATEGISGEYLTISSANSIVTSLGSDIQNALSKANSAYNYTNAVSATVKSTYWTSATTKGKIDEAKAVATDSAVTYANNTFLTKVSAGTMYSNITSEFGNYTQTTGMNQQIANASARTYAAASAYTNTQDASLSAKTFASAKTYADATFLTKASAGTMYSNITSEFSNYTKTTDMNTQIANASARTYANASSYTNTQDASLSAKTFASAKTYADNTFLTKSSAGTMYSNITNEVEGIKDDYMLKTAYVASGTVRGRWAVEIPHITSYFDGLTIHVKLGIVDYDNVYSRNTLNVNGLGDVFIYYRYNSLATSHFRQDAELTLRYREIAGTGYVAAFNYGTVVSGTTYKNGWVAEYTYFSDGNCNLGDVYESRYCGERVSRYQFVGVNKNEEVEPLTVLTAGTNYTSTIRPANNVGFRPERFFYVNAGSNYAKDTKIGDQTLYEGISTTSVRYTFNADFLAYRSIYLQGTYNEGENLFYLDSASTTSFCVQVPTNSNAVALSDYFTAGKYYIYFGCTYTLTNYFSLSPIHELFYFDGTNLIKYSKKYTDDKVSEVTSDASEVRALANSAYTYADTINSSLTNYATKDLLKTTSGAAVATATNSALTYVSNNYVTKNTYTAYTGNVASTLSSLGEGVSATSAAVKTLSGNVVTFVNDKLSKVYVYKGSVANYSSLPNSGKVEGYVYNVVAANGDTPAGTNYAWNGTAWDALGGTIDLSWAAAASSVTSVQSSLDSLSGSVVNTYATKAQASGYAVNALTQSKAYTDGKINDLNISNYLTKASAGTMYSNITSEFGNYTKTTEMNTQIANASARSVSSSVTYTNTQVANASARSVNSSNEYANANFLTKESAGTMYNSITSEFGNYTTTTGMNQQIANASARTYAAASAYTNTQDASLSAKTFASAKTYADSTFLTKASAGTMYSNITSEFGNYTQTTGMNQQIANASARTYAAASAYTNTQDASLSAKTFASAKTYVDGNYLTKASAGTMYSTLSNNITDTNNSLTAFSATVVNTYATENEASEFAAAALGNAMAYTDSKIQDIGIGDYLTRASAGTMYNNITSKFDNYALSASVNTQIANASARTYAAASAYTNTQDASISAKTFASAKTYVDGNYLTKASAGTMYSNITSEFGNYTQTTGMNQQIANASARTYAAASAYTNTQDASLSAKTFSSAKTYSDNTFLTKASAGTMYSTLASKFGDYMLTTDINTQVGSSSARSVSSAVTYVNTRDAAVSASTFASAKTYADDTFLTKASAGTMYNTITSKFGDYTTTSVMNTQIANASARTYAAASSYTNTQIANASANTFASAKTYADSTFLTKASAGTMYSEVTNEISGIKDDYLLKKAYVASGTTAGRWEVEIPNITSYFDGLTIHIRLGSSYNGTSNLLNVNGLGNKFVFYRRGNVATSHFAQWAELRLVYRTDATGGYKATFNYGSDIVSATTYTDGWVADYSYYSDSNSNTVEVYERRYAGSRLTRYQIVAIDKNERIQPLTKVDSGDYNTGATKPVNTVAIRPERFFYRNTTVVTAAGALDTAQIMADSMYTTGSRYTFNSDLAAYRAIYLRGSYDADTNLFTLNTGLTSFYVQVPTNSASVVLTDYFTSGDYYIYLGATYSSTNYFQLTDTHELFYFDGTNLVKHSKRYTDEKVSQVTSDASEVRAIANSAYTYADTINTNLSNYATKELLKTTSGAAVATATNSAITHVSNNYVAKTTYNTYTGNVASTLSSIGEGVSATSAAVKTLSGNVVTFVNDKLSKVYIYKGSVQNYSNLPATGKVEGYVYNVVNANGNIPAGTNYAWNGSAWDALGGSIDLSWAASASSVTAIQSSLDSLSGSVVGSYATKAVASGYAVNALTQANSYTNEKISELNIGNYLTRASAGTMYSNITSEFGKYTQTTGMNQQIANASARTYAAASSYTNTQVANASARSVNTSNEYANENFVTKESAGTMYNALASEFGSYALTTVMNTQIANASARTYAASSAYTNTQDASLSAKTFASAKTYADSTFLTKASAGTMYSNITSEFGNYTQTTGMNQQIANASARTYAAASAYTNTQDASLSAKTFASAKTYVDGNFLTKASAGTMYSTLSNNITNLNNSLTAFSGTVMTDYATKTNASDYAAAALGNSMAYTDSKIQDIGIGDYLTKASAGTMYNNITSKFDSYALSAVVNTRLATTSASSVSSSVTYTNTRDALVSASTFASAKTYGDDTFLTKASAGTMYSNITSKFGDYMLTTNVNTQIANASARSVNSAVTYVNGRDATLSASTFASAKTYVDGNFLTKASAGTMYSTLSNNITDTNNALTAFSATVINNYATDAEASSYAAAALSNAMDYTDSKIRTIDMGDYLTKASAGTMYNNITSKFDNYALSAVVNTQIANASARTYAAASAYTNTQDASLSAKTFASAKTYADSTFLTKASAGTMYNNVTNNVSTLSSSTVSLSAAVTTKLSTVYSYQGSVASCANLPATGKVNGYVYNVVAASGNTPAGTNYAWNGSDWDALGGTVDLTGYLTKASAGTMYNALSNQIETLNTSLNGYALSSTVETLINEVDENEEVTSAALNDLDTRIRQIGNVTGDYLSRASAGTMYNNITSQFDGYVPTGRTVNGHQLNANVTVTKGDLGLGNVENVALTTWTGNTSIASVGTVTAGTWNGTPIATTYLAKSAITINGSSVGLGGSVTLSTTDKNVGQTNSTAAERRALILGTTTAATGTALATTSVTGETAFNKDIYAIPSTGELDAKQVRVNEKVTLQYNATTEALDFIFS